MGSSIINTPQNKFLPTFLKKGHFTKRGETCFLDAVNQEKADNRFPRKSAYPLHYKHIKGTIWNSYIQKLLKIGQLPGIFIKSLWCARKMGDFVIVLA